MIGAVLLRIVLFAAIGGLIGAAYFAALAWNVRLYTGSGAGPKALLLHLSRLAAAVVGASLLHARRERRGERASPRSRARSHGDVQCRHRTRDPENVRGDDRGPQRVHVRFQPRPPGDDQRRHHTASATRSGVGSERLLTTTAGQVMIETVVVGVKIAALLNRDAAPLYHCSGPCSSLAVANLCRIVSGVTAPTASIKRAALAALVSRGAFLACGFKASARI